MQLQLNLVWNSRQLLNDSVLGVGNSNFVFLFAALEL
jgi:hypothetical protein